MKKYRAIGSFLFEVEAETLDEAYDLIQKMTVDQAKWDNYQLEEDME